ncbi:MAG TPA: Ig-like domain-containing protein [Streptosporangiaceae bacterium]|nr:Ig-like domain-containing protein [Streptosporangiaceae bacterium]
MAVAAQNQAAQPVCYSTCPPNVDLNESFHVLQVGAEEIEVFSVRVGPDVIGATTSPTGTVTIKAGSTVLCTITLTTASRGRGSCSPSASALPAGHFVVIAYYSGDSTYSPAQSHPRQLQIIRSPGGGG